ncbi:hypothetical protein BX600DRAFT_457912 [Xylariales sp. PMI_506]|nr:hypothetical protein BX600DRAFT_457912 [Xylariales sp. PMI_506]
MFKAIVGEYIALLGGQGSLKLGQNASKGILRRHLTVPSQSRMRSNPSKRMVALPTRQRLVGSTPKSQNPLSQSSRRNFHRTSRLRDAVKGEASDVKEPQGLSAKLKKMTKEYGWTALGVYLSLSVLDFPFCFLLVRVVGTEKIGEIEHYVVSKVKQIIPQSVSDWWHEYRKELKEIKKESAIEGEVGDEVAGWGVEEAKARHQAEASLGTQLALAYAIHKSFIFIRVPLTAAILPKVVKVLRSWGWKIGKKAA